MVLDTRDDWSEHQPTTREQNQYIEEHGSTSMRAGFWGSTRSSRLRTSGGTGFRTVTSAGCTGARCSPPSRAPGSTALRHRACRGTPAQNARGPDENDGVRRKHRAELIDLSPPPSMSSSKRKHQAAKSPSTTKRAGSGARGRQGDPGALAQAPPRKSRNRHRVHRARSRPSEIRARRPTSGAKEPPEGG